MTQEYPPCDGYDKRTGKCKYSGGFFDQASHAKNQNHARWVAEKKSQPKVEGQRNDAGEVLCPRCFLPMDPDPAKNSLSLDGKTTICSLCGQIETFRTTDPMHAEGLRMGQRQMQAVGYGLVKGEPKLPGRPK